jgi:hypothetical protein
MNKSRRIGVAVAVATTAVGMVSMAASAPAPAAARGPQPVSGWLRPVRAHSMNRVDVYWRTGRMICDAQVRVTGRWVDVDYPGHQPFATFGRAGTLLPGHPDFTSVWINPDFDRPGTARLRAEITYDNCSFHARTRTDSFALTLPVLRNDNGQGHGDFPGGPGAGGTGHGGPGDGGAGHGGPGHNQPGAGSHAGNGSGNGSGSGSGHGPGAGNGSGSASGNGVRCQQRFR